jgi:hypothetical protein
MQEYHIQPHSFLNMQEKIYVMSGTSADKGDMENTYKILVQKCHGTGHFEDLGVEGEILKWILQKWV